MSFGNGIETSVLAKVFGAVDFTPDATYYLALSQGDPLDDGTGLIEPVNGYARVGVANTAGEWVVAGDTASNVNDITFPAATGDWGVLTHWAILDASSGGNVIAHGTLVDVQIPVNGDTFKFFAGDLTIQLD